MVVSLIAAVSDNGVIVHTVPNRTWKLFSVLMYYPYRARQMILKLVTRRPSSSPSAAPAGRLDNNLRLSTGRTSNLRKLLPKIHGVSRTNLSEYLRWGTQRWIAAFRKNGLELIETVPLPFYFAYGYDFMLLVRIGNRIGFSSSTAFVLQKSPAGGARWRSLRDGTGTGVF